MKTLFLGEAQIKRILTMKDGRIEGDEPVRNRRIATDGEELLK